MQLKQMLVSLPFASKLMLFWERVTFSRITTFYFIFSVIHCIIQVALQVQAFNINEQAASFLYTLVQQGQAFDPGFAVMSPDALHFCDTVPNTISTKTCQLVWSAQGQAAANNGTTQQNSTSVDALQYGSKQTSTLLPSSTVASPSIQSSRPSGDELQVSTSSSSAPVATTTVLVIVTDDDDDDDDKDDDEEDGDHNDHRKRGNLLKEDPAPFEIEAVVPLNGSTAVILNGLGWNGKPITLSNRCLFALNYPVESLDNTKREDVTFVAFQFWVFGMSVVALLNESMPHIIATLLTHVLATAWTAYQIVQTTQFHSSFTRLTTQGACQVNLLPGYWKERAAAEVPSLALNGVALLLSAFLSWRLIKLFGWQTFKRVGASRTINRVYMLVLLLSIAIQLSLFFIIASVGIWIDQLYNGPVGHMASRASVYKVVLITVLILLIPWLALGWVAVRREWKAPMIVFLIMSFGYLGGWGAMFASTSFRWTFVLWRFFSLITSASVFLTLITFVLGLMCRINFGKGLSRYLSAQEPLPDTFTPAMSDEKFDYDDEKVEFPTNRALPTFSAAFGRGDEVPPPSQMKFGPPRVGPRFTNPPMEPFEPQPGDEPTFPAGAVSQTTYSSDIYKHQRGSSSVSSSGIGTTLQSATELVRQASNGSQKSYSSFRSERSYRSDTSASSIDRSKRWVIE